MADFREEAYILEKMEISEDEEDGDFRYEEIKETDLDGSGTLEDGLKTDALNFEILLITGRTTFDHVTKDRTGRAKECTNFATFTLGGDSDNVIGEREGHAFECTRKLTLRALDVYGGSLDRDFYASGDRNRKLTNAAHDRKV